MISAASPLRYSFLMTRTKTLMFINISWSVSTIFAIIRALNLSRIFNKCHIYLGFGLASCYVFYALGTYGYILWKIRRSRMFQRNGGLVNAVSKCKPYSLGYIFSLFGIEALWHNVFLFTWFIMKKTLLLSRSQWCDSLRIFIKSMPKISI